MMYLLWIINMSLKATKRRFQFNVYTLCVQHDQKTFVATTIGMRFSENNKNYKKFDIASVFPYGSIPSAPKFNISHIGN